MSYGLKELLADTAKKRGSLVAGTQGTEDYMEVWDTFNRYVTSLFKEKKGLNVTNFCKVGWVVERRRAGGNNVMRPYFAVADSFCKGFGVEFERKPKLEEKDFCPIEEFNFSKAAIRYSTKLTKDHVFSGLRYLVQQLGETAGSGRPVAVEFELGKLLIQDRKPRFAFAAEIYAKEGLQVPADAEKDVNYKPSVTFQPPTADALSLNIAGSQVGKETPAPAPAEEPFAAEPSGWEYERDGGADVLYEPSERSAPKHARQPTPSVSTVSGESFLSAGSQEQVECKQHYAYKEALDRHLTEMEIRASEAVKERQEWENHITRCLQQERDEFEKKRMLNMENADFLHQQMRWNEEARHDQRRHIVDCASAHDFPHFSEPPEAELRRVNRKQQDKFHNDLDHQVRTNEALRSLQRNSERELEASQLDANREEMRQIRNAERARKEADKETLTNSWNQEIRMKGIWKAIENHTNAAAHSVPLTLDAPGKDPRAMLRSSSGSSVASRRMPMGASQSLALQKQKMNKSNLSQSGKQVVGR